MGLLTSDLMEWIKLFYKPVASNGLYSFIHVYVTYPQV